MRRNEIASRGLRFQNFVDTYPRFALTYRLSQAPHSISYQEDTFMKFRLPIFSRREFIKTTTSAGTVASLGGALFAPNMVQTNKAPVGKKGQSYPDERRKYTDSKGGKTVWQLTNNPPGRKASYSYYNVPKVTPDERWAIYSSDRYSPSPGQYNLFKMDLRTGESVQLTESSDIETTDNVVLTKNGKEVYFFDRRRTSVLWIWRLSRSERSGSFRKMRGGRSITAQ